MTAFWIATFKRLNGSAKSSFLVANINRFNFYSSDEEVPERCLPFRRGQPARELDEDNQLPKQTRSELGLDHSYNSDGDGDGDGDGDVKHLFSKRDSMPATSKPQPKENAKPKNTHTIDMNGASATEVVVELFSEVAKVAGKKAGDWIFPGGSRVVEAAVPFVIKQMRRWVWGDSA